MSGRTILAPARRVEPSAAGLRNWLSPLLLAAFLAVGCGGTPSGAKDKKGAIDVDVMTPAVAADVLDFQDFTGRLDAFRTVELRARVTGYLLGKDPAKDPSKEKDFLFEEGAPVKRDQVIFEIDPRTYQAQVAVARADLAARKAEAVRAEILYKRSVSLIRSMASTQEDIDKQKGDWDVARAAILQSEAKLQDAELSLSFCHVTSPIDGRISRRNVDPGNLVKADDTMLTTIVEDDKVYAYFDVDERTYLELVGETPATPSTGTAQKLRLPVLMKLANGEEFTYSGAVNFLDNRLSGNTGTIRMRAEFANPRDTLKSGLFVRVRLPVGRPYRALLIPDDAIQSDQGRKYVYVVKTTVEKKEDGSEEKKEVVEYRPVTLGQLVQKMRVINPVKKDATGKITEGLADDDRVIVSGLQKVRPETAVKPALKAAPNPPEFPLSKLLARMQEKPTGE
jgi:RND family efflux transporter MFP subunit